MDKPEKAEVRVDPSQYICNLVPSKDTERDWTFSDSIESGALAAPAPPPPSVDLRAPWWKINDQEKTGSCVGWATADGVVRHAMVKAGKIRTNQQLSARHIWMASKETDGFTTVPETFIEEAGTSLKAAVDVARKQGTALASDLPFHISTNMYLGTASVFYASCAQRKIMYFNLGKDLLAWKNWLASTGPVLVGLQVDASWDDAKANGGMIDTFQPATARGGHAVALVGYRTDGRFIVRNSWGTTRWGDKGFGYVSPAYIAGSFFNESYGVTV